MHGVICFTLAIALIGGVQLAAAEGTEGADLAVGKAKYEMFCSTCHGTAGDGQGPVGKTLNPPPRDFTAGDFKFGGADQDLFDVISNGAASMGGSPLMAPWGAVIPEAERWAIIAHIRTLKK